MTQEQALDILKLGYNVLLTGPAGSGKTTLLNTYIDYLEQHGVKIAITASTGIAATHIGGQTIHSWCGMGIRDYISDEDILSLQKNSRIKKNFKNTKVLIIDEISMLHGYQLDMVDKIARHMLDFTKPFGGLQVVLCGDFFQLPPVMRSGFGNGEERQFAYECEAWNQGEFQVCYLSEQFRQKDEVLLSVLLAIRSGKIDDEVKKPLRSRYKKTPDGATKPTRLYTKNVHVDSINIGELKSLAGEERTFRIEARGFKALVETLKRNCNAVEELILKKGAEVMFIKNSSDGSFVNGTRAVVEDFEHDGSPIVRTFDGNRLTVVREEWRLEDDGAVRASLTQIPLRLAWAITIHKSQGMTLDSAEIDLSDAFEPGMGYVALSRLRSLSGLRLMGLNDVALSVHPKILAHDQKFREWSLSVKNILSALEIDAKKVKQEEILKARFEGAVDKPLVQRGSKTRLHKKPTHEITGEFIGGGMTVSAVAKKRKITAGTVIGHLEKLKGLGKLPDISHLKPAEKAFSEIFSAFQKSEDGKLIPIYKKFEEKYSFDILKLVRLFVGD